MPRFYTSQETQLQNLPRTYCFPNYILTGNTGDVTFSTVRVEQNQVIKAPGIPVMWKRSQPLYKTPLIAIPPPSFLFPKLLLRTKQFACYLETNHPRSEQTARHISFTGKVRYPKSTVSQQRKRFGKLIESFSLKSYLIE